MGPVGAIDIGTNSTRLLIGELLTSNRIEPLVTELRTTRLGDGVDASNYLKEEAMERTITALQEYKILLAEWQVEEVKVVATSAVRDVSNQQEFITRVKSEVGLEIEVITGSEEARLSYLGVIKGLPELLERVNLVVDIGGGSTEFIFGTKNQINDRFSIDVGAVRMTEKSSRVEEREELIVDLLNPAIDRLKEKPQALFGVGGTITTLAAIDQQLASYSRDKVHGYFLKLSTIKRIFSNLNEKTIAERKRVAGLQPSRADIIVAGIQILLKIMERLKINEIVVSESDMLEGIIHEYYK